MVKVKTSVVSLIVGFLFALGLGLSGMTQPAKVVGFLDLFGNWDPSLMFVMIGAIGVHAVTYWMTRHRTSPLLAEKWHVPTKRDLTPALMIGALMFGVGWGLAGYCPGPAVTSLASFEARPAIFVVSMLVGMFLFRMLDKKLQLNR